VLDDELMNGRAQFINVGRLGDGATHAKAGGFVIEVSRARQDKHRCFLDHLLAVGDENGFFIPIVPPQIEQDYIRSLGLKKAGVLSECRRAPAPRTRHH